MMSNADDLLFFDCALAALWCSCCVCDVCMTLTMYLYRAVCTLFMSAVCAVLTCVRAVCVVKFKSVRGLRVCVVWCACCGVARRFYCLKQMKAAAEGQREKTRFFETPSHRLFHLCGVMEKNYAERSVDPSSHPLPPRYLSFPWIHDSHLPPQFLLRTAPTRRSLLCHVFVLGETVVMSAVWCDHELWVVWAVRTKCVYYLTSRLFFQKNQGIEHQRAKTYNALLFELRKSGT